MEILITIQKQFSAVLSELSPAETILNKRLHAASVRVAKVLGSASVMALVLSLKRKGARS